MNIVPFNDISYKTCFYNPLFSSIIWYNKKFDSLIMNESFFYSIDENSFLGITVSSKRTFEEKEILDRIGIKLSKIEVKENEFINFIKDRVDHDVPLMIEIDSFLYPRINYYVNGDKSTHYVMITGYDDEKRIFHIIESINETKEEVVDYDLLIKCYFSLNNANLFMILNIEQNFNKAEENIRKMFIDIYSKLRHVLSDSLHFLDIAKNRIRSFDSGMLRKIEDNPEELFYEFQKIIHIKQIEKYKSNYLFDDSFDLNYDRIIEKWNMIKNLIIKYTLLNDNVLLERAVLILDEIKTSENELLGLLDASFDNK